MVKYLKENERGSSGMEMWVWKWKTGRKYVAVTLLNGKKIPSLTS